MDSIFHFKSDECELMIYLIDLEAKHSITDVVSGEDVLEVKVKKIFNGMVNVLFLRTLLVIQRDNPSYTVNLNEMAQKVLGSLLRSVDADSLPGELLEHYHKYGHSLIDKLTGPYTFANVNQGEKLS